MTTNRPPFKRNKSRSKNRPQDEQRNDSSSSAIDTLRKSKLFGRLRGILLLVIVFSIVDFVNSGSVSWPKQLLEKVGAQLGGEDASWRDATQAVEKMGEAKEGKPVPAFDITGRVVRVADGDTVSILDANKKQHKIRLYGIDTPERDQAYGNKARKALSNIVAGEDVGVVIVETDSYGRSVGTLYHNGNHINAHMVRTGYAWWYRHYAPHSRLLSNAEKTAREQSLGLWADPDPTPPWDWRRNQRQNR
ncbi:MAG: thermonuclease family protein [Halioglobus sp.]